MSFTAKTVTSELVGGVDCLFIFMEVGMREKLDYSLEWLTKELIKEYELEKKTGTKKLITISKNDLLKLVIDFIKLNESV